MARRWLIRGVCLLGLAAVGWAVLWGAGAWRVRAALAEARRLVARGEHARGRDLLARVVAARPDLAEAWLLLGDCENALTRPDAALDAWQHVAAAAPLGRAARGRIATVAPERGRFTLAEQALRALLEQPGPEALEARDRLLKLLWKQARFREVATLIEDQWRALSRDGRLTTAAAVDLLRGHISLDFETFPIDTIEADLTAAARLAPDDLRLRLAQVRWAIRAGRNPDLDRILGGCLEQAPDDPQVWLARLEWARASNQVGDAIAALAHVPADHLTDRETDDLRAWLAAVTANVEAERKVLDALAAIPPYDLVALERLAALEVAAGRAEAAQSIRRSKRALDAVKHRYEALFKDDRMAARPLEMAELAGTLGRLFERRALLTLAARLEPDNPTIREALARPAPIEHTFSHHPGQTLADVLASLTRSRPSTAAAPAGPRMVVPTFADDAVAAGLVFTYHNGETPQHQLPETMNGGLAVLDYDGDGWLDVYVVEGGPFPPRDGDARCADRLFHNRGDGTFEDMSRRAGISSFRGGYGFGVAVGDYDNDGRPDLFVTRWHAYALYHNRGDGTFEDVTERAGLGGDRDWPTSAAFADLDGDGDLDLYVCHYLKWDADHPRLCPNRNGTAYLSCDPRLFEAIADHVFRNDGGRFVDVTAGSGIVDRDGRGLGVVAGDLDGDGRVDLFVANDGSANFLFHNLGGWKFEEVGLESGAACNASGSYQAGMGTALGDLDSDGLPDLCVNNFYGESTSFFRNLGQGVFGDRTSSIGLAGPTRSLLGFGLVLLDANNDGALDLAAANGHVDDNRPEYPYAMPALLMLGSPGGRLTEAPRDPGGPWATLRVGRGLVAGDLDGDGRVDLIELAHNSPLAYFHNRTQESSGHHVSLRLEGTRSNRDAIGAVVTLDAGGRRQRAWRHGGGSFESASDPRLHFGLGPARVVDAIEVRWPSGATSRYTSLPADRSYHLREGETMPVRSEPFRATAP